MTPDQMQNTPVPVAEGSLVEYNNPKGARVIGVVTKVAQDDKTPQVRMRGGKRSHHAKAIDGAPIGIYAIIGPGVSLFFLDEVGQQIGGIVEDIDYQKELIQMQTPPGAPGLWLHFDNDVFSVDPQILTAKSAQAPTPPEPQNTMPQTGPTPPAPAAPTPPAPAAPTPPAAPAPAAPPAAPAPAAPPAAPAPAAPPAAPAPAPAAPAPAAPPADPAPAPAAPAPAAPPAAPAPAAPPAAPAPAAPPAAPAPAAPPAAPAPAAPPAAPAAPTPPAPAAPAAPTPPAAAAPTPTAAPPTPSVPQPMDMTMPTPASVPATPAMATAGTNELATPAAGAYDYDFSDSGEMVDGIGVRRPRFVVSTGSGKQADLGLNRGDIAIYLGEDVHVIHRANPELKQNSAPAQVFITSWKAFWEENLPWSNALGQFPDINRPRARANTAAERMHLEQTVLSQTDYTHEDGSAATNRDGTPFTPGWQPIGQYIVLAYFQLGTVLPAWLNAREIEGFGFIVPCGFTVRNYDVNSTGSVYKTVALSRCKPANAPRYAGMINVMSQKDSTTKGQFCKTMFSDGGYLAPAEVHAIFAEYVQ